MYTRSGLTSFLTQSPSMPTSSKQNDETNSDIWKNFCSANYSGAEKQNIICKCCQGNVAFQRLQAEQHESVCEDWLTAVSERTMVMSASGTLPTFPT